MPTRLKRRTSRIATQLICVMLCGMCAYARAAERPNKGKELYSPPWREEVVELATSCKRLDGESCEALRRLIVMPRAHWVGLGTSLSQDLRDLHSVIRDALDEHRVPTIVLYSLPDRHCGGGVRTAKKITPDAYKLWVAKVADALTYYKKAGMNIIIEPGGLSHVISKMSEVCGTRTMKEILDERIDLIRYVLWNLAIYDDRGNRANPGTRLFIDVGGPSIISDSRAKLAMADALGQIIRVAKADGISVNVGGYASFNQSRAWGKELIQIVPTSSRIGLTIVADISRHSEKTRGCNARGAALDDQAPTLDHPDPSIELTIIVRDPSTSDGDGCGGKEPAGEFDLSVFREYLRRTAPKLKDITP